MARTLFKLPGARKLRGNVDIVSETSVDGWVMHRSEPTKRAGVELLVGNRVVASGLADQLRPDLLAAGIGDGRYGFRIAIPSTVTEPERQALRVVEMSTGREFSNKGSAGFGFGGSTPNRPRDKGSARLARESGLSGSIDTVYATRIDGWVMHRSQPGKRAGIELRVGDRVVASGFADEFRPDLLAAGIGDGRYGFRMPIPRTLTDSDRQDMRVVEVSTGHEFSPMSSAIAGLNGATPDEVRPRLYEQLLDEDYYAAQLAHAGQTAPDGDFLSHYRRIGWKAGLNPHPLFDTAYYLAAGPDEVGTDPLTHFAAEGQFSLRPTHPLLDIAYYHALRPDVQAAALHPLVHYVFDGHEEDVPTSPLFDATNYNRQFTDQSSRVATLKTTPILHYLSFGWREGLKPHKSFDPLLFRRLATLDAKVEPYTAFLKTIMKPQPKLEPAAAAPRFSFVILNLNKSLLTLQCLYFLGLHTDLSKSEVVIVDNGSGWDEFATLCKYATTARIIRADRNVGFGEGNNLGVEAARGRYLVFLNNDAFVTEGWLEPLVGALEADPSVGAAGPKFLYADGRLQEAGATISPCGTPVQRGKGLNARDPLFNEPMDVDYCSAATLVVRAESFRRVLGYDLCWDPAYYEDVDLCMKLRLIGERTVYVPTSEVIHLEHQTAGDQTLELRMDGLTQINRVKFIARWSRFLQGRSDGSVERRLLPEFAPTQPTPRGPAKPKRIGLFSPYPLTPGGGERYLLSLAAALRDDYECTLLTLDRYSAIRLATLARELQLPLDHVTIRPRKHAPAEFFDVFVCMSNEVLPAVPGMGRLNIFLCQFPFSIHPGTYAQNWDNLLSYNAMMVYSRFVAEHVAQAGARLGLPLPPVHILCPAIPQVAAAPERERAEGEPFRIVNVGRFTLAGHCKRQDTMVEAFREIAARSKRPVELHLAGSLGELEADRAYLNSLHRASHDLPVRFHVNTTAEEIHDLYRSASVYWHMTGAKDDVRHMPERFEHFGITIGEAMSAGAIPITLRHGGPREIIRDGRDGFLVSDAEELRARTLGIMNSSEQEIQALRDSSRRRSAEFSMGRFAAHLRAIIADPTVAKIDPVLG